MNNDNPSRWEGTHLYSRVTPGRKARTASLVRDEAAARLREDREKRKLEAEERRRSLSVGSLTTVMSGTRGAGAKGGAGKRTSIPAPGGRRGSSASMGDGESGQDSAGTTQTPRATPEATPETTPTGNSASDATSHGLDPAQAAFFLAMEARLTAASKKSVDEISGLFHRNIERIDSNTKAISELKDNDKCLEKKLIETIKESESRSIEREREMELRMSEMMKKKVEDAVSATTISARAAAASVALLPTAPAVQSRREKAYNLCRRSLKVWPVRGDDLMDELKVFLSQRLKLSDPVIAALGIVEVSRRPGQIAEGRSEVLVTFECFEDRDLVKAAGPSLAGQTDAGLMIHVPGHLLDNLHALNGVGYSIKKNNPGVRRAVKFDDEKQDIYMDIKIGDQWRRITPAEARQVAPSLPSSGSRGSRNLSVEDLSALVQGDPVEGINAVVIPEDSA